MSGSIKFYTLVVDLYERPAISFSIKCNHDAAFGRMVRQEELDMPNYSLIKFGTVQDARLGEPHIDIKTQHA